MAKLSDEIAMKMGKGGGEPMDTGDTEPDTADEGETSEYGGDEDKAVADMMDALDSGDKEAFKSGLKAFLEVCVPEIMKGQ